MFANRIPGLDPKEKETRGVNVNFIKAETLRKNKIYFEPNGARAAPSHSAPVFPCVRFILYMEI